ncbi:ABC-type Fe3+ transport system [Fusarium albosuccineum]|uniref:ABC-type Fe3+ transport system n=1 Tax=Fusarium albosuccineum TaxID=1237068 RepID=A0A8H4LC41_9HYPO|nr:ABC-type Fe3+ transport system [Fusarium albosuccineum]
MLRQLLTYSFLASGAAAYDQVLGFNSAPEYETRSLDQIYKAALKEGDTITVWHGGDEKNQQDALKKAFEDKFPGLTLNVTVDLSKYHDVRLDEQLAAGKDAVYVDSIILQTLHDYPRWSQEGALLNYAPAGFEEIDHAFKDDNAAWYGVYVFFWSGAWNTDKLPKIKAPAEFEDWLRPEFKNKLVLTYPNDDDAVLWAFYLILQQYGTTWFDKLLAQKPRWVRGSQTPNTLIAQENSTYAAYFGASGSFVNADPLAYSVPTKGKYVSWPQTAGILKDAPHPEGAKLLHNFLLSREFQESSGMWSTRRDIPTPEGAPNLWNATATNPAEFARFMADRALVERVKLYFEARLGTAQGLSPLEDDI